MPRFHIKTLERWTATAVYEVEAPTLEEAIRQIAAGAVAYDDHDHDGPDEMIEVLELYEVT